MLRFPLLTGTADRGRGVLVVHGGGPTAVLNASLAGVIAASREGAAWRLLAARFGVAGLVERQWIDLSGVSSDAVDDIRRAPGSVIGSSRRKLDPSEIESAVRLLGTEGIEMVLFTGGNGTMQTALEFHRAARQLDSALRVVGLPKTVDNDLAVTDHTPGFGSGARFYALAVRDIGLDNLALPAPVTVVEVIGRNAGWVTAATALARHYPDDAPHLIFVPERPPTLEQICARVTEIHSRLGRVVVAACEGLRDPDGTPFGADMDRPGLRRHELAMNLGYTLARAIAGRTGLRARSEKPGLLGRSCSLAVSEVDRAEAYLCGVAAMRAARGGDDGVMVALRRGSATPYRAETFLTPLDQVAGVERVIPGHWIAASGDDVTAEFLDYARPLAGEIGAWPRLSG
ncbi:MAG: 6-phosphofructokinase [Proteobacteria bacterium]|nr:MAG: 6-phosphofructokinase [Pseudomonadota bacterium]